MPDVEAKIDHGPFPEGIDLIDEPYMIVKSLRISAGREAKEIKGGNGCVQMVREGNPTLEFNFEAVISELNGLCSQHPGTAVTDLANYAAAIRGFEITQGTLIFRDPVQSHNEDDPAEISFSVKQFPYVITA